MRVRGRLPGNEYRRIERVKPEEYRAPAPPPRRRQLAPALVLIYGFAAVIALGTLILMLPMASASGQWTDPITALFTATSAVCVTGLVVVDTGTYWSPFGHVVIVSLIQAGGFGFMTSSTLLLLLVVRRRTRLRDRVLVQQSMGRGELGDVTDLVKRVAIFTLLAEAVGAVLLTVSFAGVGGLDGIGALWFGIFHAVSAFNNAGFDVLGDFRSLADFAEDPAVLAPIAILIILGSLGFAIVGDIAGKRSWNRLALETKVVGATSLVILVGGAVVIGLLEWSNPATLGPLAVADRVANAIFESITRTAGFSAIPTGDLREPTQMVLMVLMFIGGASGSTAGGIKVNTFSVLLIAIVSTVRGHPSATAFGRRIPHLVVYRSIAVALLSVAGVFLLALGLELTTRAEFIDILFEAVSAFGTVGLSTGITPDLTDPGRLLVSGAMFIGRLGPLTLVLALAARAKPVAVRPAVETMRIG